MNKDALKNTSLLVVGIFLLIWATNAYFIFGDIGKNTSLALGFVLILFVGISSKKDKKFFVFFCFSFLSYLLFYLLGFWNAQDILSPLNVSFSLICIALLNVGYLVGKYDFSSFYLKIGYKLIFSGLAIIGSLAFYFDQIALMAVANSANVRDLGDDSLNAVGIAYTHALLFLFLFWIFQTSKNSKFRPVFLVAIIITFSVIISTLSRGAVIFLALFLLFYYLRVVKIKVHYLPKLVKGLFIFIGILFFLDLFIQNNEYVHLKTEAIVNRFDSLLDYSTKNTVDLSALEREKVYDYFFNDISKFYLGEEGYKPYPHNQFIEILMRWGIFGIPLLIFSITIFIKSLKIFNKKHLEKNPILFLIISLFVFSYLQSMTSMSLEMNRMMWFGFGFIYSYNSKHFDYSK